MNPITNPYAPGAGTRPPELAGRDEIRKRAEIVLGRSKLGMPVKSMIMVGLRGVGKTVLLDRIRLDAEPSGIHAVWFEAPENRSLPSMLAPQLRVALLRLSNREAAKQLAQRALAGLAGFARSLKVKYSGHRSWPGFRTRTRIGGQRRLGNGLAGPAGGGSGTPQKRVIPVWPCSLTSSST